MNHAAKAHSSLILGRAQETGGGVLGGMVIGCIFLDPRRLADDHACTVPDQKTFEACGQVSLTCCASDIVGHRTGLKATRARLRIPSSLEDAWARCWGMGTGCASKAAAPTVRIEMLSLQRTDVLDSQTGRC